MKICFLYKDYSYNYSLHSCSKELRALGIHLTSICVKSAAEACANVTECDLLLVDAEIASDAIMCQKNSVAIYSTIDGAHIAPVAHWLAKFNIAGLIKSYVYTPRSLHNLGYYWLNMKYLQDAGYQADGSHANKLDYPLLSEEQLAKVHAFCGFGSWERQIHLLEQIKPDLAVNRPIPIHFAGWMDYCGSETESHRKKAVEVCNSCGGIGIAGRSLEVWEFRRQMLDSRCVLSPWGWGEACHRDFEALAVGAILVKPDWSFVETFPDLSSHSAPYIPCKLDFSDVPTIVNNITNNWKDFLPLRKIGYQLACDAVSPTLNARRFADILSLIM